MPKAEKKQTHVRLDLGLHPGQKEVWNSQARFRVVACGRQWGKSRLGSAIAFEGALKGKAVWWVAPDYPRAIIGWRLIKSLTRQIPGAEVKESEFLITFGSGGWLQVKGAHNEGALRGVTLDQLVVDEAAFMRAERWHSELRPTLAVREGSAVFISTFDGENFFYDLYLRGQDPEDSEWESWRKPSSENPYLDPAEVEEARRTTPRAEFEQEWLANPLVYVGAVFDGEDVEAAIGRAASYSPDLPSYAGLDWGYTNPTALEVCQEDVEGRVRWIDERLWTATELTARCEAIADICADYGVAMMATDAAGATENATLAAAFKRRGTPTTIKPVPFSKFKEAGISARRWYLESGMEAISQSCSHLGQDTKRYRYQENKEDVVKENDHTVDAATAFYATRSGRMVKGKAA